MPTMNLCPILDSGYTAISICAD